MGEASSSGPPLYIHFLWLSTCARAIEIHAATPDLSALCDVGAADCASAVTWQGAYCIYGRLRWRMDCATVLLATIRPGARNRQAASSLPATSVGDCMRTREERHYVSSYHDPVRWITRRT